MTRIGIITIVLLALSADAAPKHKHTGGKIGKGFWKVLVTPKAHWVLRDSSNAKSTITVETYDVRKVGEADVARLRWTYHNEANATEDISGGEGKFSQVAVTAAGLYLLDKADDDAKIAKVIAGKPSRSDPPKPYDGTKLNHGRYLHIRDDQVCMGTGPEPGAGDCPDTCDGAVCITTAGIASLYGTYAPDGESIFDAE